MDVQLLLALIVGIAVIIFVVLRTRLDAFVALLLAAIVTGLLSGFSLTGIASSIQTGFGNTLGSIGIVIGLGVIIGKILEVSGAADALARAFLKAFGKGREEWAMGSVGSLVSIPVFCDSGYVIMNPLARSIARVKRGGYVALALALGCGMTLTHHMVPPTPGPLAATGILGADLGLVIVTGLIFTVILLPVVVLYARWVGPQLEDRIVPEIWQAVYGDRQLVGAGSEDGRSQDGGTDRRAHGRGGAHAAGTDTDGDTDTGADGDVDLEKTETYNPDEYLGQAPADAPRHSVGAFIGSLPLLIPLLLILFNTVTAAVDRNQQGVLAGDYEPSGWAVPFAFLGNPVVALVIGTILAVYVLLPRWVPQKKVHGWFAEAAASAGLILLITGAGGAFGQVLRDSGVGDALAEAIAGTPLPAFLVPFIIASVVRIAQGSGTVAIITAASVTAPLISSMGLDPLVAVMACVTGSMVFSYFNDSYFWVVTRFTGLEGTDALKGWSMITTAVWAGSLPLLFILNLVVG